MLTPTERSAGLLATTVMQSVITQLEDRRKEEEEAAGIKKKADPLTQARIAVSEEAQRAREKIVTAMFSHESTGKNELLIELTDRLAGELGIDADKARSTMSLGRMIEDIVSKMDTSSKRALEQELGIDALGITLDSLVSAIVDPYGNRNSGVMSALEAAATGGGVTEGNKRILSRLKDVADPRSLEELKVQDEFRDPSRINDKQARAETAEAIQSAEASEKLDDLETMLDGVEERNDSAPSDTDASEASEDTLLLLAAVAETVETLEPIEDQPAESEAPQAVPPLLADEDQAELQVDAAAQTLLAQDEAILPVSIEDGIYSLLRRLAA